MKMLESTAIPKVVQNLTCLLNFQLREVNSEKHSDLAEVQLEVLRPQEIPEEELKLVKQAKEEAEERVAKLERELGAKEECIIDQEKKLSAAQQKLHEYGLEEPRHWVISRDEIHMTDTHLGTGARATVVLGRFRGCEVAVKQIHHLILSPHTRRRFEREINIASRCRHPCLLQFIGATNDEGSPLFVTEVMETSLRALLQKRPLSRAEISVISLDVGQALNYLHKSEPPIIHRDVRSANVLLWRHGDKWRGKVSGYGTADFVYQCESVDCGSGIYSSPEASTRNQTVKVKLI